MTADVALAQWQYYLATGDQDWLRARGWPVLPRGRRVLGEPGRAGRRPLPHHRRRGTRWGELAGRRRGLHQRDAATTLRLATRAAQVLGETAPGEWASGRGAGRQPPQPLGGFDQVRPEFRGYAEQQVKQADAVLLTYPWEYQQPAAVDRDDLDYYALHYDPDGPAMTDSVNSIVARPARAGMCRLDHT